MLRREPSIKNWNPFSAEQWLAWLGATLVAGVTAIVFFYSTFETKDSFDAYKQDQKEFQQMINERLERIENKIDQLTETESTKSNQVVFQDSP